MPNPIIAKARADSQIIPANCATSTAVSGMMISTPNCCAVRASLTREDTTIAACNDRSAAAGETRNTSRAVRGVTMARTTPGSAKHARPMKYSASPAIAIARVGISDPSTFATSSSIVPIGVASKGSSVLACFSPTMECAASAIAPVIGVIRNSIRNCWNRNS